MTLPIDEATVLGALYGVVKKYPGKVKALAADLDMPESTLYAKLRGEAGYPTWLDEFGEILDFARARGVDDWSRALHVLCYRHDHLAIPIPHAFKVSSKDGLRDVSQLMQEVAEIAQALSDATDPLQADGECVNSKEMKRIDHAIEEAMEKLVEVRERYRAKHVADKKKGLVK